MKLLRFLFRYSPRVIIATTLIGILGGVSSMLILMIINAHLRHADSPGADVGKFVALCAVILLANLAARVGISRLTQWSAFDLRLQLGRQWINTPLAELERKGNVKLFAAITQDVERLADSMRALPGICIDITVIVACLGYLAYLSWWVLLVMVGAITVAILSRRVPEKHCERLLADARSHGETLLATFNAMGSGIKELKMNMARWNSYYSGELYETAAKYRDQFCRAEMNYGFIRGYSEIIYFLLVGLLIYGSPLMGELSPAVIVGFAVTLLYVKTNIDHVQDNVTQIARAQIALANLESLGVLQHTSSLSVAQLRSRTTREQVAGYIEADAGLLDQAPRQLRDSIAFTGIEYEYARDDGESGFALGPVDLTIHAGELLFVIGGNGSGKTTFAKLLCGLYEPQRGHIALDGVRIEAANRNWYTQHFGTVFADSHLFEKLYGAQDLPQTDAVVTEYLKDFKLQDKVDVTGGRFSTISLSQGQKKRLALVTACVEDRPIYLFDEWAADQDPEFREFFYCRILSRLHARGKTVIVISHDDRYYHVASRIVKFERGRFIAGQLESSGSVAPMPEIAA
jgi:putative ATP-binding cassette transporter